MSSTKDSWEKMPLLNNVRALNNKNKILKLIFVLIVLFAFYNIPTKYLGDTYPICLYRIVLHKNCWGCGTTRAIWSILHFNFNQAFEYNPRIVIIFPLLAGCVVYWVRGSGAKAGD
jgi:hypothetical protein